MQTSRIGLVILLLSGYVPALLVRSIPMVVGPIHVEALLPSEYFISVPFYIQTKDYYCGPAALQMIFDYHGENVSQLEIADAARTVPNVTHKAELRRAAHFSNLSTSQGSEMPEIKTGYTGRKLGYCAFEKSGMSIEDLKTLIAQDFPVILLMTWEHGQIYGHYRVAVGFNLTHIFLHDPWNKSEWGGTYGGPNLALNYSFVDTMWDYSEHWGLIVTPWKLDVRILNAIPANDRFIVTANVTYVKPAMISVDVYPASSCMATIALPEGLTLAEDENATKNLKDLQAGETVQTQWTLETTRSGSYSFYISAKGKISGTVPERPEVGSEYSYQDLIGIDSCKTTITVGISSSPGLERIEVIIAASITITAIVASGTALYYLRFRKKKQTSTNPNWSTNAHVALYLESESVARALRIGVAWAFFSSALLLNAVGDILFSYTVQNNTYYTGHPLELLFHTGYILCSLAFYTHERTMNVGRKPKQTLRQTCSLSTRFKMMSYG